MTPNLSPKTIAKMRAVIAAVLAEPQFYDQSTFPETHNCGEVCCAAGWAVWLDNPKAYRANVPNWQADWQKMAEDALGLGTTGYKLFRYASAWPEPYGSNYYSARDSGETSLMAKAMADRWEHFIATDGAE